MVAVQWTAVAGAGETTIITAGTPGVNNILVGLVITTINAAAGTLTLRDSTGGTTRMVIDFPNAALAPAVPFILMLPEPLPQAAPAQNWTIQASVNASGYNVNALYKES